MSEPKPPDHLSRRAKAFWRSVVREYELELAHVEVLRRLCEAMDRADQAVELLTKEGLTVIDRYDQVKPHPAAAIEIQNRTAVARLIRELGIAEESLREIPSAKGRRMANERWKS